MWELVKAGGWLMLPLVLCSIFTVAISIERFIRLKRSLVLPKSLMLYKGRDIDEVLDVLEQDQSARQSA
jgi:biopolymer transport protein ExbB